MSNYISEQDESVALISRLRELVESEHARNEGGDNFDLLEALSHTLYLEEILVEICTCDGWVTDEPGHEHRGDEEGCTVGGCACERATVEA